jgi:hypothetical protein
MNRLTEHDELQNYINGKYKRRMTMELWIAFYAPNGRELCSYTLEGTFDGEMEATKEQLAHDHGLYPDDITIRIVKKEKAGKHER